jgi:hypothetical protein
MELIITNDWHSGATITGVEVDGVVTAVPPLSPGRAAIVQAPAEVCRVAVMYEAGGLTHRAARVAPVTCCSNAVTLSKADGGEGVVFN